MIKRRSAIQALNPTIFLQGISDMVVLWVHYKQFLVIFQSYPACEFCYFLFEAIFAVQ